MLRLVRDSRLCPRQGGTQCQGMTIFTELASAPSDCPEPFADPLRLAVAAYLARFKGSSRDHTESGQRSFLAWCAERGLDPLAARRTHLELYIRWMQEIRRFKPSTVSRRFSVAAGFYGPAPSTASWSTRPPSTSAAPSSPPTHHPRVHPLAVRGPAHRRPPVSQPL
jgi:hypothetical protein